MSKYFVAGRVYQNHRGTEGLALLGSNREDSPFLIIDGARRYFKWSSQQAHLYEVEKDYTLAWGAFSYQAQALELRARHENG